MSFDIRETLKELCEVPGPSGFEEAVVLEAKKVLEPYMDEVWVDTLGNLIGLKKCGKPNAKRLLIDAHIDEIGFVVTEIEQGFLKFSALGGLDARLLPAAGVFVLAKQTVTGVVCVLPRHILKPEDTVLLTKIEDMYIDVGLSQEEAERLIPIGSPGVLLSTTRALGEDAICSKALDNRAGFVAILNALEKIKELTIDVDLYVMASVQQEVGARGAGSGAFSIAPDYAIAVDTYNAKTPDATAHEAFNKLGDGVIVARGPNMDRAFTDKILELAENKQIKHQLTVIADALIPINVRDIQVSHTGVQTAFFAIPLKYMHSANEVVSVDDIESASELLAQAIVSMKGA